MDAATRSVWDDLVGQVIVLDVSSPYLIIGRLDRCQGDWIVLRDADVHDLRDTGTSRETYLVNSRLHGVHANRRSTWVRLAEVVSISRLEDVLAE
jgi:hypothetical protein